MDIAEKGNYETSVNLLICWSIKG